MMNAAKQIGNVWYTDDAEYAVRGTVSGSVVVRGDGSYAEFLDCEEAAEAAEMLAKGFRNDDDYVWVDA